MREAPDSNSGETHSFAHPPPFWLDPTFLRFEERATAIFAVPSASYEVFWYLH